MKIRGTKKNGKKLDTIMAPMIDVVFLLLIFFMLTLKITPQEGNVDINMPLGRGGGMVDTNYHVQLIANADGTLRDIVFNNTTYGTGEQAYEKLNEAVATAVGYKAGSKPLYENVEIEIEADYKLHYNYTIKAVGACKGRLNKAGNLEPFVEKIKFTPPKPPVASPNVS